MRKNGSECHKEALTNSAYYRLWAATSLIHFSGTTERLDCNSDAMVGFAAAHG
jgi:hypothetical protein